MNGGMFGGDSYSKLGACVVMNDKCWLIVCRIIGN